jgi:CCR4-NOT transcription complex subunit 6
MFNQGHQGQHGRVNGGPGARGLQMMFNYQHQNSHQQQHTQHHPNIQQDHNTHTANGLGHHTNFSSGVLSNAPPSFTPSNLNGHGGTTRGGQAQAITEAWAEQLKLHKEAERIHQTMLEQGQPNHYARVRAGENKGLSTQATIEPNNENADDEKDPLRMAETVGVKRRKDWVNLDISGQGIRVISPALFNFDFLSELYLSSNKLTKLPASIGQLRNLRHIDVSNNQLSNLPPELGMCVCLERILVFDNRLHTLPFELGYLHNLEMLGIEGNKDLDQDLRQMIMDNGTVALITHLRENAPGKSFHSHELNPY